MIMGGIRRFLLLMLYRLRYKRVGRSSVISIFFVTICGILLVGKYATNLTGNEQQTSMRSGVSKRCGGSESTRSRRPPDLMLIGQDKCGTTVFHRAIERIVGLVSLPHDFHFTLGFDQLDTDAWLNRLPCVPDRTVIYQRANDYFRCESVPKRIYAVNPATKFIVMLRDPIERAKSHYQMIQRLIAEGMSEVLLGCNQCEAKCTQRDYEEYAAWANKSFDEMVTWPTGELREARRFKLLFNGMYDTFLASYLEYFKLEQFFFVDVQEPRYDLSGLITRLEKWLHIEKPSVAKTLANNKECRLWCLREPCVCPPTNAEPNSSVEVMEKLHNYFKPRIRRFCLMIARLVDGDWRNIPKLSFCNLKTQTLYSIHRAKDGEIGKETV